MSTINRIEVANFLNLNGEGEHEAWSPRYRDVLFNFRGQSTAMNMTNGVGKTSNVEAWLALLTRDATLISRTREKMAPERDGYYSHVRVEFLVPAGGSVATDDFFVMQGDQAPGRETWVFGLYGYRSAGSVYFYHYRGTLEQVPVADHRRGGLALLPNKQFRDALKAVPGSKLNPVREDWIAELELHVSPVSMRRQAEYQKRGGGDKSAELFALKSRPGERYDVTFFYEVIAPELLSGLMDREGEEDEHEFEDTVLHTVMDVIRTRHNTQRKKAELDKVAVVLGVLDSAAHKARAAEQARSAYRVRHAGIARDLAMLDNLVRAQPLPGIPRPPGGDGLLARLQARLIIEPGKRHYRILDAGIAELTGETPLALNKRAQRAGAEGRRIARAIRVLGEESLDGAGKGPKPHAYTPESARELAESGRGWAGELTRAGALALLDDLDDWFMNQSAHGNPYRTRRNELEYDIEQAQRDLLAAEERQRRTGEKLAGLHDQQTKMEAAETDYRELQASGRFTPQELETPKQTVEQVLEQYSAIDADRQTFLAQKALVEGQHPHWDAFQRRFPDAELPEQLHQALEQKQHLARQALGDIRAQKARAESEGRDLQQESSRLEEARVQLASELKTFESLAAGLVFYAELFGEQSPTGLDTRVIERLTRTRSDRERMRERIAGLQVQVDSLVHFRRKNGAQSPADWLAQREQERTRLQIRRPELEQQRTDLQRQRQELDREQVAAGPAARQAVAHLEQEGIAHRPLHRAVEALGLADERKRAVLSCFSALLFAPVTEDPDTARRAAACLAQQDAQVPVFMGAALEAFARDGDLSTDPHSELFHGLIAGVTTRTVRCLLDPQLVEREKARLDQGIDACGRKLGEVEERLRETGDQAPITLLARQAQVAVQDDAEAALIQQTRQSKHLEAGLPRLELHASGKALGAIRDAQAFQGLGGREKQDGLTRELADKELGLRELRERSKCMQARLESLLREEQEAQAASDSAYTAQDRVLVQQAGQFVVQGGMAFLRGVPEKQAQLKADLERADARKAFQHQLKRSALYLAARQQQRDGVDINGLIAGLEAELEQAVQAIVQAKAQRETLQAQCKSLDDALTALDRVALLAQQHFIPGARLKVDLPADTLRDHELYQQAEALHKLLDREAEPGEVIREAELLEDQLGQLEIERDLEALSNLQQASDAALDGVLQVVTQAAQHEALSQVERERLAGVRELGDTRRVTGMAADIRAIHEREQALYRQAAEAETQSRGLITERIGYFVDSARDNLDLFRRVVRVCHGGERAHFKVSADMIAGEESVALIGNIITTLDEEEAARNQRRRRGMESSESDIQYRTRLRELIRKNTHRRIFKNPAVKYVSPNIRQDERPRPLTRALSSGQRTAMTLQWIIRLADYAISREMQASVSRVSLRRRARERAQSILFIDGLFSDLSDEHLIREAMSGIRNTRGRFQLIGLIHNSKYNNDFDVFPVLLLGKLISGSNGTGGWVSVDEQGSPQEETVQVAEIRKESRPMNAQA